MSVLKSILHHWNSTSKAYDTLHPETEAAQVTDWHESVIGSLASKVLPTVVSELTTDSVMGKLMKMLLTASGVKYSIDTNGYVCLGSFFGGLIIQWGKNMHGWVPFPISFTNFRVLVMTHQGLTFMPAKPRENNSLSGFTLDVDNNKDASFDAQWIAIGI